MGDVSITGIDLVKDVFQLHGATADGSVVVMLYVCLAGGDQD
jgi:hypothetical protein